MGLKKANQEVMETKIKPQQVENRLHLLEEAIAATSTGIVICDAQQPEIPIVYCNPAFEKITGYSPEEVQGSNCRFLQGVDTDADAKAEIRASLREKRQCHVVLKNYRKDGTAFWNELNISPVRDAKGDVTHFIGVQNDISISKQAQLLSDRFFTLSVDLLCIVSFDGYFQQLNLAWEKILGFTEEELLAKPSIEFIHPEDREASLAELKKMAAGSDTIAFENRYLCKDGSYKWLLWNAKSVPQEQVCYATARDITESKRLEEARAKAEAALKESEEKYRNLVEISQDIIWSLDIEGKFTFVNQAVKCILGYEAPEMIGHRFTDFQAPEQGKLNWQLHQRILAGEPYFKYETVYLSKDGRLVDLSFNAIVLRDEFGNILGFTGTARDISDRKRAEEAMRNTEAFLNSVLESLPIGVCTKDAKDLRFVYVNKEIEELFGYSREQVLGKNDYELFPKEQADFFRVKDNEAIATGKLIDIPEEPLNTKAKGLRKLHTRKISILDREGRPQYLVAITEDITERKQIEMALRESKAKFKKLVANVPGMIYQFVMRPNSSAYFPYVSPGSREMFELEPDRLHEDAMPLLEMIHPDDRRIFYNSIGVSAETLQPWQWEGRFILPSGQVKWIQGASRPERLSNGDVVWDGLLMDISDRKQAEEALRRSKEQLKQKACELEQTLRELQQTQSQLIQTEKMSSLGQLVAGVAHEINNPVNFIYGNILHTNEYVQDLLDLIQLYADYYPNPVPEIQRQIEAVELDFLMEDLPKTLASMKMGADRILQIVASLRSFSRLDQAEKKPVDIHEGLDSTLLILQHRLKEKSGRPRIQIIKQYDNISPVECYAGQLNQVFMNILSNAVDALEENCLDKPCSLPTIRIRTEVVENNRVAIRISDNGPGMDEEVKGRLFDPFFTTKEVGKGTGLGLAISYQIVVEKHGGTLQCFSAPGKGAEFLLEIPIHQDREESEEPIKN